MSRPGSTSAAEKRSPLASSKLRCGTQMLSRFAMTDSVQCICRYLLVFIGWWFNRKVAHVVEETARLGQRILLSGSCRRFALLCLSRAIHFENLPSEFLLTFVADFSREGAALHEARCLRELLGQRQAREFVRSVGVTLVPRVIDERIDDVR